MMRIRYGPAGHRVPGAAVEPGRVHPHEHLVGLDLGPSMSVRCHVSLEP